MSNFFEALVHLFQPNPFFLEISQFMYENGPNIIQIRVNMVVVIVKSKFIGQSVRPMHASLDITSNMLSSIVPNVVASVILNP